MKTIVVTKSNRLENLADALCDWTSDPIAGPLDDERVIVQSRGLAVWLTRFLARRRGICANLSFPFPKSALSDLADRVMGEQENVFRRYSKERMTWVLMSVLKEREPMPAFRLVKNYVAGEADRRLALAERVADLFEQYLVYRLSMLRQWERGVDRGWQAELWRAMVEYERESPVHLTQSFVTGLASCTNLPTRLSVFGPSTLPPLYLDILQQSAQYFPVHLFVHAPSPHYWGEVRTRVGEIRRAIEAGSDGLDSDCDMLATFGHIGRDFQVMLESQPYRETDRDLFSEPDPSSLLNSLQADVYWMKTSSELQRRLFDRSDDSLRFHACHSPMREVEVLQNQLLSLFEETHLGSDDVLVMTPDINAYAPLIEAVFGLDPSDPCYIPYTVSDRRHRESYSTLEAFFALLEVLGSRFNTAQVLDLLTFPAIRAAFVIESVELDQLNTWIAESGIRWAADSHHRQLEGQPESDLHTWRFGLERLFLGFAFPSRGSRFFAGRLGYDHVEGRDIALLGKVAEFVEALNELRLQASKPQGMTAWTHWMDHLIQRFFGDRNAFEVQALRQANSELRDLSAVLDESVVLGLSAVVNQFKTRLEAETLRSRFLSGGVTFCEMLPMRAIPFPVIYLLGMSESAYPRPIRRDPLDLIAQKPAVGDRSRRHDDMYLFLETLLSAREKLVISYVGQSQKDNSEMPPSVAVMALWDAIATRVDFARDEHTACAGSHTGVKRYLLTKHPLQPFSTRYFDSSNRHLRSYSPRHLAAAQALSQPKEPRRLMFERSLQPSTPTHQLELKELVRFFKDPVRALLRRGLGVMDRRLEGDSESGEKADLSPLDVEQVGRFLIDHQLSHGPAGYQELLALGRLPLGGLGRTLFLDIENDVQWMVQQLQELWPEPRSAPLFVRAATPMGLLVGSVAKWKDRQLVRFNFGQFSARHLLATWIELVAVSAAQKKRWDTVHIFRPGTKLGRVKLQAPENPQATLESLMDLFEQGMRSPLPLHPEAAWNAVGEADLAKVEKALEREMNKQGSEWWSRAIQLNGESIRRFSDLTEAVVAPIKAQVG